MDGRATPAAIKGVEGEARARKSQRRQRDRPHLELQAKDLQVFRSTAIHLRVDALP